MTKIPFVRDIAGTRSHARQHIENGAVTEGYRADREVVIELLNEALATEIVCSLRYRRHYFMAKGPSSKGIADELLQHAQEELAHADMLAERIAELGGEPDFNPESLASRSESEYVPGSSLLDMVQEDLVAERIAIEAYSKIIRYLGNDDPTTRRLMEEILAKEEEHAVDLADLLGQMGPTPFFSELPRTEGEGKDVIGTLEAVATADTSPRRSRTQI
jgi:bacterioferritin